MERDKMVAAGESLPSAGGSGIGSTITVAGLVVGGAGGLFFGFGFVFWLFDPKAMEIPGLGDFAFFIAAIVSAAILGTVGLLIGRGVDTLLARRRNRPVKRTL
jgi:hypothetical protein